MLEFHFMAEMAKQVLAHLSQSIEWKITNIFCQTKGFGASFQAEWNSKKEKDANAWSELSHDPSCFAVRVHLKKNLIRIFFEISPVFVKRWNDYFLGSASSS